MHVYAADPAQRFALINDKRVAEGSPLENDLDVREIRPDGVVLEFRGERFLLPRTGR
jgi:general secretion pathway protein B